MGLIKYEGSTLINAKNNINECNSNIIDALQRINNEIITMEETMSTPKSKNVIASYGDYYNEKINNLTRKRDNYNTMLNNISAAYNEYFYNVNEMVGGSDGIE